MKHLLLLAALPLIACRDDMSHQRRYDSYEASALFADGKALQAPPDGTVSRDRKALDSALATQPPLSTALLERGRQRYAIACTPCHDAAGYGLGVVPARGFPTPPNFHDHSLRRLSARAIVGVITDGYGTMYSFSDRVSPADRWAIAAYVKALQLSQDADLGDLTPDERRQLGEARP